MMEKKSTDHFTKFKNFLLRSGIPLEAMVTKKIQDFGLNDQGEYSYERDGKLFSIDINAFGYTDFEIYYRNNLIALDFLIECKYREENKKWLFLNFKQPKDLSFRVNTLNIYLDFPLEKRLNEYGYYQRYNKRKYSEFYTKNYWKYFPKNLPKVHKGVEIHKNGFNPNSITEAIFQLIYATGSAISEDVKYLCNNSEKEIEVEDGYLYIGGELAFWVIPIIVTTATLFVLRENVTIEDIKKSKSLNEIADEEKAIFYEQPENINIENYIKKSFTFKELMLKSNFFTNEDIEDHIEDFSNVEPRILIINYQYFDEIFKKTLKEINEYFSTLSKFWSKKRKRKK